MATTNRMIDPFVDHQVRISGDVPVISYGLSSYGYDARCDRHFKIFHNAYNTLVDPKKFDPRSFVDHEGDDCIIPPNSFVLTQTVETFTMPDDVLAICLGKSTYARCGLVVNCTPLEPAWRGQVTLEISNTTPLPARIYAGEGIAQFLFFGGSEACSTSYADRGGKYQDQTGVTVARV
jgi:dCTP deaminase